MSSQNLNAYVMCLSSFLSRPVSYKINWYSYMPKDEHYSHLGGWGGGERKEKKSENEAVLLEIKYIMTYSIQ